MNRTILTWSDFHLACLALIGQMTGDNRIRRSSIILPVIRGGLAPAAYIAYAFELTECIHIKLDISGWSSRRDDLIIVDDISDTGRTFRQFRTIFPHALYVSVYAKPEGAEYCHYYGEMVKQSDWLVFPWAPNDEINR